MEPETSTSRNLATKIVAIGLISIFANAGLAACSRTMADKNEKTASEFKIVDVSNDNIGNAATVGGWQTAEDQTVTEARRAVFEKATEKLVGSRHEPIAYLASQTVSGTNHCFLAKTTTVRPGAVPHYTLVYIYEDLQNNLEILKIEDVEISAEK